LFTFNLRYISITLAPTTYTILFWRVGSRPILVLFPAFLFILCRFFEVWYPVQLPRWRIGRAMLNRRMSVPKVPEVVNVSWCEKSSCCKRMNRCVTPLSIVSVSFFETFTLRRLYPFHPESPTPVHHVKELVVLLTAEPIQASNLKVAPEVAHVVLLAFH
jgi:hypothetical protein